MQLQSTLLFLTTLLATASALPSSAAPKTNARKVKLGETAYYPGVLAQIQGWTSQYCPDAEKPTYSHTVDQEYCYKLAKTTIFHSYKLWQPVAPAPGWLCTFKLHLNEVCTGPYFLWDNLPAAEKDFECDNGVKEIGAGSPPPDGFRSFRYACECNDAKGCTLPAH